MTSPPIRSIRWEPPNENNRRAFRVDGAFDRPGLHGPLLRIAVLVPVLDHLLAGLHPRRLTWHLGIARRVRQVTETALLVGWLRSVAAYDRPLLRGEAARPFRHLTVGAGLALPLALRAVSRGLPRPARNAATVLGTCLTLAGGLALRYTLVVAGAESADDPEATFRFASAPRAGAIDN